MKRILVAITALTLLGLPGLATAADKDKLEGLTELEEDKAGYNADVEVDFRNLSGSAAADGLSLTIDLWTAWADIPEPEETEVSISLGKAKAKAFTEKVDVSFDGTWELRKVEKAKKSKKSSKGKGDEEEGEGEEEAEEEEEPKTPALASGNATIDGHTITLTIPWEHVAHSTVWIQVSSMHDTAEEGDKVYTKATDVIPNGLKRLEIVKP